MLPAGAAQHAWEGYRPAHHNVANFPRRSASSTHCCLVAFSKAAAGGQTKFSRVARLIVVAKLCWTSCGLALTRTISDGASCPAQATTDTLPMTARTDKDLLMTSYIYGLAVKAE
jgi:hypothetical protein